MTVQEKLLQKKRGIIPLTCTPLIRLASHCLLFNVLPDVHLLVRLALWETVLNVTVGLQIRRQIVGTELSTRLSTGGTPAFHIDLSGTYHHVHTRALCTAFQFSNTRNNRNSPAKFQTSSLEIIVMLCF